MLIEKDEAPVSVIVAAAVLVYMRRTLDHVVLRAMDADEWALGADPREPERTVVVVEWADRDAAGIERNGEFVLTAFSTQAAANLFIADAEAAASP